MREGVTVHSTSPTPWVKEDIVHLHLLFSIPCLKHIPVCQNVQQADHTLNTVVSHQEPNTVYESYIAKCTKHQPYVTCYI